jgi:hypothetical protein
MVLQKKYRLFFNKTSIWSTILVEDPNIIQVCHKKSFQWQHNCSTLTNNRQEGHEEAKICCSQYFANATKNSKELDQTNPVTSTVGSDNV